LASPPSSPVSAISTDAIQFDISPEVIVAKASRNIPKIGIAAADTDFVGTQGMAVLRSRDTPWRRALGVELTWGAYRPKAQTNPTRSGWRSATDSNHQYGFHDSRSRSAQRVPLPG